MICPNCSRFLTGSATKSNDRHGFCETGFLGRPVEYSTDLCCLGDRHIADFREDTARKGVLGKCCAVLLRLLPGESYATNKTYKVQFRFAVCGKEALSSVLTVKVMK